MTSLQATSTGQLNYGSLDKNFTPVCYYLFIYVFIYILWSFIYLLFIYLSIYLFICLFIFTCIFLLVLWRQHPTKFCGFLIHFHEVMELRRFELDVSDAIPTNLYNISSHSFLIFFSFWGVFSLGFWRNFLLSIKFSSIFDHFSWSYEVAKFWIIKRCVTSL